jgi:hypothetical protein
MEWVLILMFYICMGVCIFFFALFAKLLNRGELQMVGNISFPLLMHNKRGGRARNNGSIGVLSSDGKKVTSSWLYYAFESVLLSHSCLLELVNSKRLKYRSVKMKYL